MNCLDFPCDSRLEDTEAHMLIGLEIPVNFTREKIPLSAHIKIFPPFKK
jgi:hypothetical protein